MSNTFDNNNIIVYYFDMKVKLIVPAMVVGTGIIVVGMKSPSNTHSLVASTISSKPSSITVNSSSPKTVSSINQPATTVPATSSVAPATSPIPPVTKPDYGEDSSNPGTYKVFNKSNVMTSAGISLSDQATAQTLIDSINPRWVYKENSIANMCMVAPASKMSTAGSDYLDNPVTQLKWCNSYAIARYGSWSAALDYYQKTSKF